MDIQKYLENKKLWLLVILVLVILTLTTTYYGSTDIGDYADSARLFAGKYRADIRNSHSYVFGFFHAPYFFLFNNWLVFKISSLVFLLATVFSVYYIKNKDKRFLWLMLLSPAVWYMAPWINPIQIASLGMLWSWFFIQKYDESNGPRILLYSGIFLGLAWAFWNTILFLGFFLWAVFLMNKKLYHTITFFIGTMIGLMPLFLLDYSLFGFPFYTLIKTTMSNFVATLLGGIYGGSSSSFSVLNVVLLLLTIPLFF
ncbi:MAG: hypothetical protein KKE05_04485, partial [Nanoarchaeota archaeon]|nr:hypothetical protein [Nanoarchaeota archaeon]